MYVAVHGACRLGYNLSTGSSNLRYFGSKASATLALLDLFRARHSGGPFGDPFGGIATVASLMKAEGVQVHTGDILDFAYSYQVNRIQLSSLPGFRGVSSLDSRSRAQSLAALLNRLPGIDGPITQKFAVERGYFQVENAKRIDAIIAAIDGEADSGAVTELEARVLRCSLAASMDRVANTAGTYYAYLKSPTRRSLRPFEFRFIRPVSGAQGCTASKTDAEDFVTRREFDILYLDPPFNRRNYARYYHLPDQIAAGTEIQAQGKSGQNPRKVPQSEFNCTSLALASLERVIAAAKFKTLFVQYSSSGLIPTDSLEQMLLQKGTVSRHEVSCLGYTTRKGSNRRSSQIVWEVRP